MAAIAKLLKLNTIQWEELEIPAPYYAEHNSNNKTVIISPVSFLRSEKLFSLCTDAQLVLSLGIYVCLCLVLFNLHDVN